MQYTVQYYTANIGAHIYIYQCSLKLLCKFFYNMETLGRDLHEMYLRTTDPFACVGITTAWCKCFEKTGTFLTGKKFKKKKKTSEGRADNAEIRKRK